MESTLKTSSKLVRGFMAALVVSFSLTGCGGGTSPTPPNATLSSIVVTPDQQVIIAGSSKQFTASGHFSDGTSQDISSTVAWSSSNPAVATINSQGLAVSAATGTTIITATSSTDTGSKVGIVALAVTVRAGIAKTGQTTSYFPGDDGNLQKGFVIPAPRFTANGDGTITDKLTGLMWLQDGKCIHTQYSVFDNDGVAGDGMVIWQHALDFANSVDHGAYPNCSAGYSDWRIPNINEIKSLANKGVPSASWLNSQGFINVEEGSYWSSTTDMVQIDRALTLSTVFPTLTPLYITDNDYKSSANFVMLVRDGAAGAIPLLKTGQTGCFDSVGNGVSCANTGQDGELQKGIAMPNPRFTNPDGTIPVTGDLVTDQLTGLVWTRSTKSPGPAACLPGATKVWVDALRYIDCLNTNNYEGYSDWRLPNINEYETMLFMESPTWLAQQGFDIEWGYYSSSTAVSSSEVLTIQPAWKQVIIWPQSHPRLVWPVRGGQ